MLLKRQMFGHENDEVMIMEFSLHLILWRLHLPTGIFQEYKRSGPLTIGGNTHYNILFYK